MNLPCIKKKQINSKHWLLITYYIRQVFAVIKNNCIVSIILNTYNKYNNDLQSPTYYIYNIYIYIYDNI